MFALSIPVREEDPAEWSSRSHPRRKGTRRPRVLLPAGSQSRRPLCWPVRGA